MRREVPVFGLSGSDFPQPQKPGAAEPGSRIGPGPLFWRQQLASYTDPLKIGDGSGAASLREAATGVGLRASPGHDVTYTIVGGSHKVGSASKPTMPHETPKQLSKLNLRFVCSQSTQARLLKGTAARAATSGRGAVAAYDCTARFTVAIRNAKSRARRCSICRVIVEYKHDAEPDPEPFPTALVGGACPWAARHGRDTHIVRSGFRVTHAATLHTGHYGRRARLEHRVPSKTANSMAASKAAHQASNATVASLYAHETGAMLSTIEVNRAIRRGSSGGGADTGIAGLLQEFQRFRADVAYVVRWHVVNANFVKADYSVAGDEGALRVFYELYLPPAADEERGTFWDVTELINNPSGIGGWSVAVSFFRSRSMPNDSYCTKLGVKPALTLKLKRGQALNASAIYWQTERQTAEALRCMSVGVTDTTCKTNSTVMEYGVVMGLTARLKTIHQGHYVLNGLSRANYCSVWKTYRLFMGACAVGRTSFFCTDGDPWLVEATESEASSNGSLDVGGKSVHALCRFHGVNTPLIVEMAKHGFTAAERAFASDVKDRIHAMFRSCETESELMRANHSLRHDIGSGGVLEGPTRRRRLAGRKTSNVYAHRTPSRGKGAKRRRGSKKKFEVQRFVSKTTMEGFDYIEVKWVGYNDTTREQAGQLLKDLGEGAFTAFCRAAAIDTASIAIPAGPDALSPSLDLHTVEAFVGVAANKKIKVKWLGFPDPTEEPASELIEDIGLTEFTAFCNAADIALDSVDRTLKLMRDGSASATSILLRWYTDTIWPKRRKFAWGLRRGIRHLGTDTTGAAENNFLVLKSPKVLNDKAPARELSRVTAFQERRRFANLDAARATEFGMMPPPVAGVPDALLGRWARAGLRLIGNEARLAGLGGTATYHIWPVQPQSGSGAQSAWVLQHAMPRPDGTPHRVRVIHETNGVLRCTCWVWEVWSVECRHCLAIHGCVSETSAALFWRRGTVQGINDDRVLPTHQRPLGPAARTPALHASPQQPNTTPAWRVAFHPFHTEFVEEGVGLASKIVPAQPITTAAAERGTRPQPSNYHLARAALDDAARISSIIGSESTRPSDALELRAAVAALRSQAEKMHAAGAKQHPIAKHNGNVIVSEMRASRPGQGSFARGKSSAG